MKTPMSDIIKERTKELGIPFEDIPYIPLDILDILGLPVLNPDKSVTWLNSCNDQDEWTPP